MHVLRRFGRSILAAAALVASTAVGSLDAQAAAPQGPPRGAQRDSLEQRVRDRMMQMLRTQLGLDDEQARKLALSQRKFESQHRDLFIQERQARASLREELALNDTARQAQVGRLLDQMLGVQKRRMELIEAEQRELATFMSPIQRARYFGMQEQIRRRIDDMREQRGGPDGPGGQRRPGGMRPPDGTGGPIRGGVRRPPVGAS